MRTTRRHDWQYWLPWVVLGLLGTIWYLLPVIVGILSLLGLWHAS